MTGPSGGVGVLGAGSWGTALAILLAHNGLRVKLWGRNPRRLQELDRDRCNARYLPGITLPDAVQISASLHEIATRCNHYMVVVPSHGFRETLEHLYAARARIGIPGAESIIGWGTKGLEPGTGKLLSDVFREVAPSTARYTVISGPTFASEVAQGLPAALTAAAPQRSVAEDVAGWLRGPSVRVYTNTDAVGVQLGGAIKNVMAIATGIADGLKLGANARAALITRGLAELRRLGQALGGAPETFMGLTGVGDLILTCTDNQSRNRRVGIGLGTGRSLNEVLMEIGQEAEGVNTSRELYRHSAALRVDMPITEQVYGVLFENQAPSTAVTALLEREPRAE